MICIDGSVEEQVKQLLLSKGSTIGRTRLQTQSEAFQKLVQKHSKGRGSQQMSQSSANLTQRR